MREIKFRAWDTDKKIMIEPNDYDFICYSGHLGEAYPHEGDGQPMMSDVFNRIIMQFTGLEDKNGKEIYEGDILEIEWENTTTRSIVKYHVGYASSGFVFMIGGSGFSECSGIENGKVIGNIYENPELLNKLNK